VKDITVVQDRKNDASKQLIAVTKRRGRVEFDPAFLISFAKYYRFQSSMQSQMTALLITGNASAVFTPFI
jgi:hypothetical protein